jgi:hypothetical protein
MSAKTRAPKFIDVMLHQQILFILRLIPLKPLELAQ